VTSQGGPQCRRPAAPAYGKGPGPWPGEVVSGGAPPCAVSGGPGYPGMHDRAREWFDLRTSHWQDWPLDRLLEARERTGAQISVVIPARNEQHTVGGVVTAIRDALMSRAPLIDEIVVIDSDSADETAQAAAGAGATVHRARDIAPALGAYPGKGEALWKALLVTQGDLLVFIDADLTHWGTHFVTGLLGPLLADPGVQLVKGFYARLRTGTDGSASTEGGRVTELVARPLLSLWWPELGGVVQPLAGEWAARRGLMESLRIPVGYGVELSTLLDTAAGHGLEAIAQVDLDARAHRHQADHDLALMAAELLLVAERRRGPGPVPPDAMPADRVPPDAGPPDAGPPTATLQQFVRARGRVQPRERPVPVQERPPVATVRETVRSSRQGAGS
jgi:glucosyl-3-phosphoglycerate synthase